MGTVKQWIPLESNPEILTKFGHALGIPSTVSFNDVYSLDLLDMVPLPRYAILLLYPIKDSLKDVPVSTASTSTSTPPSSSTKPFFCKQTISNACGTIALIHAALNANNMELVPGSFLHNFQKETKDLTPEQRAVALHNNASLDATHTQFAEKGQSAVPADLNNINMHFVCFVRCQQDLYILDGRKNEPIFQGPTSEQTFLQDTANIIQNSFMAVDPEEHRYTITALTDTQDF